MIGNVLAATFTAAAAPAIAATRAVRTWQDDDCQRRGDCATPRPPALAPRPPFVTIFGFEHQDVVRDVWLGWTGTVIHTRKIGSDGGAVVRWANSFAQTPLGDVAHRLALVQRRQPRA